MINLKFKSLIVLLALLLGCTGYVPPANYPPNNNQGYRPNNPGYPPNNNPGYPPYYNGPIQTLPSVGPRDDSDYTRRRTEDPDRDSTLSRAKKGDSCENERSNHECYDLCKEMYRRKDDKEECAELTPDNITAIYDVWTALKTGRLSNLEGIDEEPLDWFINVSIAGFDSLIRDYRKSDAEDVLIWIAENSEVAEVMRDEDDDFETLEELLSLVDRFELDTVENPFIEEIDRKTLFEYAINTGNDTAMDYFLDYFLQTHKSCRRDNITVACLTVICKIGAGIDERDRENLFNSNIFSDFVKDIIKDKINGADSASGDKWVKGTGESKIDSINDLDDSWASSDWDPENASKPICGGLVD
ncbi:MAG: hypothetical protein OXJ52_04510 [Oligoflexia bacterium]|nr:hypothetical protein [Oligoflexia bacterium]